MNCLLLAKRESTYINIRRCIHKYQGTGIQRYDKFLEAKEIAKANEGKVEDPLEYTILGNKKKSKKDIFFYSDRISGKGYSHYSSTIYMNRPYVWPPIKKLYEINKIFFIFGMIFCFINFDYFLE